MYAGKGGVCVRASEASIASDALDFKQSEEGGFVLRRALRRLPIVLLDVWRCG
jgi:hypothetical protein